MPRVFNSQPRVPAHVFAKAVGSFVPRLTQKAFEKYGFSAATLLTDWAQIVGAELARVTAPERLKWPRGAGVHAENEEGSEGRPGATLALRVDPIRALDVEYQRRQIIERINAYFGYRAVAELRLLQAPLASFEAPATREARVTPAAEPSAVPGDPLSRALARLEAAVTGRASAQSRTA